MHGIEARGAAEAGAKRRGAQRPGDLNVVRASERPQRLCGDRSARAHTGHTDAACYGDARPFEERFDHPSVVVNHAVVRREEARRLLLHEHRLVHRHDLELRREQRVDDPARQTLLHSVGLDDKERAVRGGGAAAARARKKKVELLLQRCGRRRLLARKPQRSRGGCERRRAELLPPRVTITGARHELERDDHAGVAIPRRAGGAGEQRLAHSEHRERALYGRDDLPQHRQRRWHHAEKGARDGSKGARRCRVGVPGDDEVSCSAGVGEGEEGR